MKHYYLLSLLLLCSCGTIHKIVNKNKSVHDTSSISNTSTSEFTSKQLDTVITVDGDTQSFMVPFTELSSWKDSIPTEHSVFISDDNEVFFTWLPKSKQLKAKLINKEKKIPVSVNYINLKVTDERKKQQAHTEIATSNKDKTAKYGKWWWWLIAVAGVVACVFIYLKQRK